MACGRSPSFRKSIIHSCTITLAEAYYFVMAVPRLRRLVAGLPPWRPEFDPGSVHVGFVRDEVAMGQVFPEYFGFPLSISFHGRSLG